MRIHQIQPTKKSKSQICISRHLLPPCIHPWNGDALKGHDGGLLMSACDVPPSGCFSSMKMIIEAVSLTMPGSPPCPSKFCFHLVTFDRKYPFWKKYQLLRDQSDLRHLYLTLVPPLQRQRSVKTQQIWNVTLKTRQDEPDDYLFLRFTAWYPAQWNEQG